MPLLYRRFVVREKKTAVTFNRQINDGGGVFQLDSGVTTAAPREACADMSWMKKSSIVLIGSLVSGITRESAFIGRALPRIARCPGQTGKYTQQQADATACAVCSTSVGLGGYRLSTRSSALSHRCILFIVYCVQYLQPWFLLNTCSAARREKKRVLHRLILRGNL